MEDPVNLSSSLKSLTLQNLNLTDEVSVTSPGSFYPPVRIPLSAPRLKRPLKTPRFHPNSAPVLSGEGRVGDMFFGRYDEDEEDWMISYHQRKHSKYPEPPATEDGRSLDNISSQSGSSSKAISGSLMKKQTNPWKNSKRSKDQLLLGKKQCYTNLVTSPLVPKVIPVAERVEMIIQEFAPCLSEGRVTSHINEIKRRIKNIMIEGIKLRAVKKLSQTRTDGKQLLWEALTSVTQDLFEKGTELKSYDEEGIETFIGNMSFIGDMGKLNIVNEVSTLSTLSHICRQHQHELHPVLLIGAEAIIQNSNIDLTATPTGQVILEYLYRTNQNWFDLSKECHHEQDIELYKVRADYYTPDESVVNDYCEKSPDYEFYDLYDTRPVDEMSESQKVP